MNHATRPGAGDISRMLAARCQALVAELLPHGKRDGAEWRVGSLAGEAGGSLGVHLHGSKAGVWADFSSGECGDALDLVAAILYGGDRAAALRWAATWLGLGDGAAPDTPRRPAPPAPPASGSDDDEIAMRKAALRIFLEARENIAETPADLYLRARGIDLSDLAARPRALRFHGALYNSEVDRRLPALVAAISRNGEHVATHRTWLEQRDGVWVKAHLAAPKKTLGRPMGGVIPLWRGVDRRSLKHAAPGSAAVIGEGIETCLSVTVACPEYRTLCAVSLSNLLHVALPPAIAMVIIAADNDGENLKARRTLQLCINRFIAEGRDVRIARSPIGSDFNDCLKVPHE